MTESSNYDLTKESQETFDEVKKINPIMMNCITTELAREIIDKDVGAYRELTRILIKDIIHHELIVKDKIQSNQHKKEAQLIIFKNMSILVAFGACDDDLIEKFLIIFNNFRQIKLFITANEIVLLPQYQSILDKIYFSEENKQAK